MAPPSALASLPMVPGMTRGRDQAREIRLIQLIVDSLCQFVDDRLRQRTIHHNPFEIDDAGRRADRNGNRRSGGADPLRNGVARFRCRPVPCPGAGKRHRSFRVQPATPQTFVQQIARCATNELDGGLYRIVLLRVVAARYGHRPHGTGKAERSAMQQAIENDPTPNESTDENVEIVVETRFLVMKNQVGHAGRRRIVLEPDGEFLVFGHPLTDVDTVPLGQHFRRSAQFLPPTSDSIGGCNPDSDHASLLFLLRTALISATQALAPGSTTSGSGNAYLSLT